MLLVTRHSILIIKYMSDWAIRFHDVSKKFPRAGAQAQSVLELLLGMVRGKKEEKKADLWALKGLTYEIKKGETVGFVGTNGSGKSTMLKLAARIMKPTSGLIEVAGRVSALLEMGAGFHNELTGRENVFLSGALMGLEQSQIEAVYDDVVAFSEVGDFIDIPVKHYSSGMYMRLAFSVAVHVKPDILFIDEILAVGDQSFQNKCFDRIHALKQSNMTIVIVSHDLRSMQNMCERLIWINQGEIVMSGEPRQVLSEYTTFTRERDQKKILDGVKGLNEHSRWGSGEVKVTAVRLLDGEGKPGQNFRSNEPMTIELEYDATEAVDNPQFGLAIFRQDGIQVNSPNSFMAGLKIGTIHGRGCVQYRIDHLALLPSIYRLTISVHDKHGVHTYDYHDQAYTFQVTYTENPETHGLVSLPATWHVAE